MKLIDRFEAAHMSAIQFIDECWTHNYTYQDYLTAAELCSHKPVSQDEFNSRYAALEANYLDLLKRSVPSPHEERLYYASL